MSPATPTKPSRPSRPRLADQIAARRDELRLLALPDINAGPAAQVAGIQELPLALIEADANQPRREFNPVRLAELAASIRSHGVITPILVAPIVVPPTAEPGATGDPTAPTVRYRLVAGERRWRAARVAGRETIPALIREVNAAEALELALIENLHRQDLSPIEEALAYRRLLTEHEYTQQQLGSSLSRSQTYISKRLSLLALDPSVVHMIESGELSASAARELARLKDQALQRQAARAIADGRLNARQIERAVRALQVAHEAAVAGRTVAETPEPRLAVHGEPVDLDQVAEAAHALLMALRDLPIGLDSETQQRLNNHLKPVSIVLATFLKPASPRSPASETIGDEIVSQPREPARQRHG